MKNGRQVLRTQKGFSLIEIMIVLTLIAVAGTFVVGQLIAKLDEGNYSAATTQVRNLKTMLEEYRRYCGVYPTSEQNLDALVSKPSSPPDCPNYPAAGILAGKMPADPWGHPYQYESADGGKSYVITCLGKDGADGGEGFDKDIKSNEI